MRIGAIVVALVLGGFCALKAAAYGAWQDQTPIGGVELSDGETRDQLGARFDAIGRENAAKPYIVTRAKRLATLRWADLSPEDQNHFIATAEAQER